MQAEVSYRLRLPRSRLFLVSCSWAVVPSPVVTICVTFPSTFPYAWVTWTSLASLSLDMCSVRSFCELKLILHNWPPTLTMTVRTCSSADRGFITVIHYTIANITGMSSTKRDTDPYRRSTHPYRPGPPSGLTITESPWSRTASCCCCCGRPTRYKLIIIILVISSSPRRNEHHFRTGASW